MPVMSEERSIQKTSESVAEKIGISPQGAYELFRGLEDAGLVEVCGRHREEGQRGRGKKVYDIPENLGEKVKQLLDQVHE